MEGIPFHGEVLAAADATAFTLYKAGSTDAYTLNSNQRLVVTDFIGEALAGTLGFCFDTAVAGKVGFEITLVADPLFASHTFGKHGHMGPLGVVPKVIAGGGGANAVINGFIIGPETESS